MSKVLILVEGQTEETFVREVLGEHLAARDIYPVAKLITTRRVANGTDFKGGITSYDKFKNDVRQLLNDTSAALVTTMVDFYGLPSDFPRRSAMSSSSCYERVAFVEQKIERDINHSRFTPYLALHEFEAMLFANPEKIDEAFPEVDKKAALRDIRNAFHSPEEIDDDPQTAPSKRIEAIFPEYDKPLYGTLIALEIGLAHIRRECAHFNDWLTKLENLEPS